MFRTVVDVKVAELGRTETVFGKHTLHHLDEEGVLAGFHSFAEAFSHEVGRSESSLTAGIAGVAEIVL